VAGRHGHDLDRADGHLLAAVRLVHVGEASGTEQAPAARGDEHRRRRGQQPQRRHVQVVEMDMRDQHGVDAVDHAVGDPDVAPQVGDARGEQRIREEAGTVEIDQDGGMAHPRELAAGIRRGHRSRAYDADSCAHGGSQVRSGDERRAYDELPIHRTGSVPMSRMTADDLDVDTRHWWIFLVTGALWIIFAWVVLTFDIDTVWTIAVFFGLALLAGGVLSIVTGLDAPSWRWLHITFGVIAIIGGFFALAWPGQTFLVMAAIIGWYVLLTGILDLVVAFSTKDENDLWWLQLILGIAQILIGFWAVGYTGRSIALLVIWVGATALARGISNLVIGFGLHGADKQLRRRMAA
jgi:uncharacterized membrane protein HdeD (DUF308 family)